METVNTATTEILTCYLDDPHPLFDFGVFKVCLPISRDIHGVTRTLDDGVAISLALFATEEDALEFAAMKANDVSVTTVVEF